MDKNYSIQKQKNRGTKAELTQQKIIEQKSELPSQPNKNGICCVLSLVVISFDSPFCNQNYQVYEKAIIAPHLAYSKCFTCLFPAAYCKWICYRAGWKSNSLRYCS